MRPNAAFPTDCDYDIQYKQMLTFFVTLCSDKIFTSRQFYKIFPELAFLFSHLQFIFSFIIYSISKYPFVKSIDHEEWD